MMTSLHSLSSAGAPNTFCLHKSSRTTCFSATSKKRTLSRQATLCFFMKKQGFFGGGYPLPRAHVLYMRARRRRRCPHARARETRSKTHHGPPVAPPARAWCVLFRVSRAREPMYHRCRGLRGRASHPKVSFLAVQGNSVLHGNMIIFAYSWVSKKSGVR